MHLKALRATFALLALASLLLPAPAEAKRKKKKDMNATELYESGLKHMRRGYYTKALEQFQRVRNYHRDDPVSVKAQLAIADVHFKKGDYDQARYAYEEFSTYHPRHEALDWVVFRTGMSIYKRSPRWAGRDQTATRGAVNVWTGYSGRFADSEHLPTVTRYLNKARNRLAAKELFIAKFYARRDAWGSVQGRCERLLQRYPDTEHVPEALALLGTAYHAWGMDKDAQSVRDRLASDSPDSPALGQLDRLLSKPLGERPEEQIFIRPYRIRGMSGGGQQ